MKRTTEAVEMSLETFMPVGVMNYAVHGFWSKPTPKCQNVL